jgi:tRNA dimethylallyltransferase
VRPRALAITGPTTSGKTTLAVAVARTLRGEIVSMDSRQVYRGMDIGTDKVTAEGKGGVPHYGLDLVDPDERYSAGQFARDARRWIGEIEDRGHVPILVGGTGFFLKAVVDPMFREPPLDASRRDRLRSYLRGVGTEEMGRWARRLDPERAELAMQGGTQRLSRTLEVALLTGRPLSWWHRTAEPESPGVPAVVVILELPREELDRRIDERVSKMVERGFVEEVEGLLRAGFSAEAPGMTGTGYREVAASLEGSLPLDDALDRMRLQTRQYARRQMTWFRRQAPADAIRIDGTLPEAEKVESIVAAWRQATEMERA